MTDISKGKNGGARRGAGRPKGSRNKQRPMVETLAKLKIHAIPDLVAHYDEIQKLIKNAKRRDDTRDANHVKTLMVQRGQVLRGLLPYAFHKQAQIVSVEDTTEPKKPISIKLTVKPNDPPRSHLEEDSE